MAGGGEDDYGGDDQGSADVGARAEVFAQEGYAEDRSQGRARERLDRRPAAGAEESHRDRLADRDLDEEKREGAKARRRKQRESAADGSRRMRS